MKDTGTSVWSNCTVFSKIEVEKAHTAGWITDLTRVHTGSPKSSNWIVVSSEVILVQKGNKKHF